METALIMPFHSITTTFKSYYVVWKQGWSEPNEEDTESLNRTMQYGNAQNSIFERRVSDGLNRTMQYGNAS